MGVVQVGVTYGKHLLIYRSVTHPWTWSSSGADSTSCFGYPLVMSKNQENQLVSQSPQENNTELLNTQTATAGDCFQEEKEKTKTKPLKDSPHD